MLGCPEQLRQILETEHGSWYSLEFGGVKTRYQADLKYFDPQTSNYFYSDLKDS